MIAGHFGLAAAVKARARDVPLWSLMLATAWLDVVFVPLFLLHIETIERAPDALGSYGGGIIHADYTHSLVGAIALSVLFGAVLATRYGRRAGVVLALVSFSHWVLDLVVHRADLPILPANYGSLPKLGFGLWRMPVAAIASELALVLLGAWLYWRAASSVAKEASKGRVRATFAGALVLLGGIGVLYLDASGILG